MKLLVAKQGNDVFSPDPNDFIFHSDYNTFKIIDEGYLSSQTVDADPKTITVVHNQSITPAIFAFVKFPDGYFYMPNSPQKSFLGRRFVVEFDATNIYFVLTRDSGVSYSVDIKYFIMEMPL